MKIPKEWRFLLVVLAIYAIIGIFNYSVFENAALKFGYLLIEILPTIAVVFGLLFVANLLFTPKKVIKHLGKGSGIKGWLMMIVGGVISTGPAYIWYPLLKDLREHGMKNSLISGFIYSRAIKLPFLPIMIVYFGWEFTVILTIYMAIFSVINGIIVEKIVG
ncbi:MAG: hypothetical protein KAS32_08190 [Candidatus Peribacteraceae bacterium]|nr:hypothetical protein [Candidatus Peribacteraceae bacterium]